MNKLSNKINIKITGIIILLIFVLFAIGLVFAQSLPKDYDNYFNVIPENTNDSDVADDIFYNLSSNIDKDLRIFDAESLSPIKNEKPEIINLRDEDNYKLVDEINIENLEKEKDEFTLINIQDLLSLDISTKKETVEEYASPEELGGYNFIFIAYHQKTEDKKEINSFYEIYFDDKLISTTNQGSWNKNYKFFTHNLEKDKEYQVMTILKESTRLGGRWLEALKIYQPNYYVEKPPEEDKDEDEKNLYPISIVHNYPEDKVLYLVVIWIAQEKRYEIESGYLHKGKHSNIWKAVSKYFLQDE